MKVPSSISRKQAAGGAIVLLLFLNVANFIYKSDTEGVSSRLDPGQPSGSLEAKGREKYNYRRVISSGSEQVKRDLFFLSRSAEPEAVEADRKEELQPSVSPGPASSEKPSVELVAVTEHKGGRRALVKTGGETVLVSVGSQVGNDYRVARIERDRIFLERYQ